MRCTPRQAKPSQDKTRQRSAWAELCEAEAEAGSEAEGALSVGLRELAACLHCCLCAIPRACLPTYLPACLPLRMGWDEMGVTQIPVLLLVLCDATWIQDQRCAGARVHARPFTHSLTAHSLHTLGRMR